MPWYSFKTLWPKGRSSLADATRLPDDDEARHYARRLIKELRQYPDYSDPRLKMVILNNHRDTIEIIQF